MIIYNILRIHNISGPMKHNDEHGFKITSLSDPSSVVVIVHRKTNEQPHVASSRLQKHKKTKENQKKNSDQVEEITLLREKV